jgi:hypothetical protein
MGLLDTNYQDRRLTASQKKKIKPAIQGGGYNYLGEQEEVTVPRKWLSDPDHVVAELVYITPREKKVLIDLNMYGSLDGKPNNAPGGLPSLQGDMGSVGGGKSSGGGSSGGGGGDSGDAREQYAAKQTSTGFVGGGGAVTYTGGDRSDPSSYTVADAYVTPEQIQRQTENYQEQFGGISPLGSRKADYSTKYEYDQIKYLQQNKLDTVIGKLKQAGYDIDWDAGYTDVKDYISNLSKDEMASSYKDLGIYSPETITKWEQLGYMPEANVKIESQFPQSIVFGANFLADKIPGKPLTKDELLADLNAFNEIGQSQDQMSWMERLEKYSPKQYESLTGTTYDPMTKTYTVRDRSDGSESTVDSSQIQSLLQPTISPQPSVVNRYFSTLGMGGQTSSSSVPQIGQPLSSSLQTSYNNAKTTINNLLGITPPSQQFGYSAQPYGLLSSTNVTSNPFNIDYLKRLGLI